MPDDVMTVDAVVVGAGPAGSAAALALARAGRDVVMVERRVTHRCTGTSAHHWGTISSRIRP